MSETANHTPGPWEIGARMTRVEVLPKGWNMPMCVADCGTEHAPDSKHERVANARLIASAPDLLAACRAAVKEMDVLQPDIDVGETLAALRAAIALAEGK